MKQKCYIFGIGENGKAFYERVKDTYEVVGFSDNNKTVWGSMFCGKPVIAPELLKEKKDCTIYIPTIYYREITAQLRDMGITNVKSVALEGALTDATANYIYFDADIEPIFSDCVVDYNKADEIIYDFAKNYGLEKLGIKHNNVAKKVGRILFCAYHFPPFNHGGMQRSAKFVKYLSRLGYNVTVLTTESQRFFSLRYDPKALEEIPDNVDIIRVDEKYSNWDMTPIYERQQILNLCLGITKSDKWVETFQRSSKIPFPDKNVIWVNACLRYIAEKMDLSDIDLVFTTGQPYSSFLIGYYLKKSLGMSWVMEYRDPWSTNDYMWDLYKSDYGNCRSVIADFERTLLQEADLVIFASENMQREYVGNFDLNTEKTDYIYNGYDDEDFENLPLKSPNLQFTICHNGSIYGDRNAGTFLRIITDLIDDGAISPDKIKMIINGYIEKRIKDDMESIDKYNIVSINDIMPHGESLVIGHQADLLLLLAEENVAMNGGVTGKFFEYIRMGVPILALSLKGGFIDKTLKESRTGEAFSYADAKGIRDYLINRYKEWEDGKTGYCPDCSVIERYSRESEANQLAEVLSRLLP